MRFSPVAFAALLLVPEVQARLLDFDENEVVRSSEAYGDNQRPRIAFTADGTAHLIWAAGTFGHEVVVHASAPEGGRFGSATLISPDRGGVEASRGSGPTLRASGLYLAAGWEDGGSPDRGIWVNRSSSRGNSWEIPRRTDPGGSDPRVFQAVGLFPEGRLAQSWMAFDPDWTDPLYVWAGEDESGGFRPPVAAAGITEGEACDCCYNDQIVLDDGQTVLVAFRNNNANLREVHVVRSTDGGATFPEDHPIDSSGWIIPGCPSTGPHLAAFGNDVMATWQTQVNGAAQIRSARSLDGGATWNPMTQVDDFGGSRYLNFPQVAVRGTRAVIVWEGMGPDRRRGIFAAASVDAGLTWGPSVRVTDNTDSSNLYQPTADFAPGGELAVAWRDFRLGSAQIFHSTGRFACDLEVDLSDYPVSVPPGETVRFTATVSNPCQSGFSFDAAQLQITGPVAPTLSLYRGAPPTLSPGNQVSRSFLLNVPPAVPIGTYTATLVISLAGESVASDAFECRIE